MPRKSAIRGWPWLTGRPAMAAAGLALTEAGQDRWRARQRPSSSPWSALERPSSTANSPNDPARQWPDMTGTSAPGRPPLHHATMTDDADTVSALLTEGADPNVPDRPGFTALHFAAQERSHLRGRHPARLRSPRPARKRNPRVLTIASRSWCRRARPLPGFEGADGPFLAVGEQHLRLGGETLPADGVVQFLGSPSPDRAGPSAAKLYEEMPDSVAWSASSFETGRLEQAEP
jgi:ankyrin repeat protein